VAGPCGASPSPLPTSDTQRERLRYALRARLDMGGLQPFVTLEEKGELSLAPLRR
jgi:hypothetical protein